MRAAIGGSPGGLKNLIVLNSGHKIAPEPLEQALAAHLPEAQQVVLLGNQRSYLAALVTTARRTERQTGRREAGASGDRRVNADSAALQTDSRVSYCRRAVQHRKWFADGQWQDEARRDCRAIRGAKSNRLYQKKPA